MRKMGTIPLMTGVVLFLRGKVGKDLHVMIISHASPLCYNSHREGSDIYGYYKDTYNS